MYLPIYAQHSYYCSCFLSGRSPVLPVPQKAELLEVICMLLLDKHYAPAKGSNSGGKPSKFTSRWKLIISSYNQVQMKILNSKELLDHIGLHLFTINESTLASVVSVHWLQQIIPPRLLSLLLWFTLGSTFLR